MVESDLEQKKFHYCRELSEKWRQTLRHNITAAEQQLLPKQSSRRAKDAEMLEFSRRGFL